MKKSGWRFASAAMRHRHRPPPLCKRSAVSARRRNYSVSLFVLPRECFRGIDSGSAQEISETRIGTERTKLGTEHIAIKSPGMLLERAIKPAQRFVFLAEGCVHGSD